MKCNDPNFFCNLMITIALLLSFLTIKRTDNELIRDYKIRYI